MRRRGAFLLAAVWTAASFLGACAPVGPNSKRPPVPTPPQYRFDEGPPRAESLADFPWWQVFNDEALQALIRDAIANNLDLRQAAAHVEEARALVGVVKSALYPQVNATGNVGLQGSSNDDSPVLHGATAAAAASWELDLFGRIRREKEAAVANLLATEQGQRGVLVSLVGDVASNYILLRELDFQLDISLRTVQINDQTVEYFQNRLNGGVSNRLELDQVTANRAQTAAAIPDIERQIAITEDALSLLLARSPGPTARETGRFTEQRPFDVPPGLPASLLERRPDVMQAEQLLVAANADVGVAKALFFPSVSLTGLLGGVSGDLLTLLGGP